MVTGGKNGAYEFSFGHYRNGWLKTIMSYGKEEEKNVFSDPNISCGDFYGTEIPCGLPADDPASADNAPGIYQYPAHAWREIIAV